MARLRACTFGSALVGCLAVESVSEQVAAVGLRSVTGSWKALFCLPIGVQVLTTINFLCNASVETARSHLERRVGKKKL